MARSKSSSGNKTTIARLIAKQYHLPVTIAVELIDNILSIIKHELGQGKRVTFKEFGSFYAKQGSRYFIVGFKPSKQAKADIAEKHAGLV